MISPAIPGFFYDSEKKKYFKIQANHLASPGSSYTKDAIQQISQEQRERKRIKIFEEKKFKQQIGRSKILTSPLLGEVGLGREREVNARCGLESSSRAWAEGLEEREKVIGSIRDPQMFALDEETGGMAFTSCIRSLGEDRRDIVV